jgi:hypothetical protein
MKALVIFLAVFAFATIGYNAAVNLPKAKDARSDTYNLPTNPSPRPVDFDAPAAVREAQWAHERRIAEELNKKRDAVNKRYDEAR